MEAYLEREIICLYKYEIENSSVRAFKLEVTHIEQ